MFIGFAMARTPGLLDTTKEQYFDRLSKEESGGLSVLAKVWSDEIKRPVSSRDVVIGGLLDAMIHSAMNLRDRILPWNWHFIRTPRHLPFVVSDWPAWGQRYGGFYMLSFPISSEVALITSDCPDVGLPDDAVRNVAEVNKQTMSRASTFVVCHQESFPGDDSLDMWVNTK